MNKKHLFIIAGANGTGKTTLAKEFLKEYPIEFLNADEIAKSKAIDIAKRRIKAGKLFFAKLRAAIKNNHSFAIESTLSGTYLIKIIKQQKKNGYKISIIYFFVDNPAVAIDRIQIRVKKGGHPIPEADVIRRFPRSKSNFWNIYRKLADEWSMFYNGAEKLIPVATGIKDKEEIIDEALLKLFRKDMKR